MFPKRGKGKLLQREEFNTYTVERVNIARAGGNMVIIKLRELHFFQLKINRVHLQSTVKFKLLEM